jgi:hypothetical protein
MQNVDSLLPSSPIKYPENQEIEYPGNSGQMRTVLDTGEKCPIVAQLIKALIGLT